jgi:hypothetical protein
MQLKHCPKCGHDLPIEESFSRNKRARDGRQAWCKSCHGASVVESQRKHRDAYNARQRAWTEKNRKQVRSLHRDKHLQRIFGLTPDEYDRMLAEQGGVCAICKQPETKFLNGRITNLVIDHNHSTGHIRGLLCDRCNRMIGYSQDNDWLLRNAAEYLVSHRQTPTTKVVPVLQTGPATGLRNGKYTHPESTPRGANHGMATLTQERVDTIFRMRGLGRGKGEKLQKIADTVGVSRVQVVRILGFKTSWRPSWSFGHRPESWTITN